MRSRLPSFVTVLFVVCMGLTLSAVLAPAANAQPFDCKEEPLPERPGDGIVGSLDPPTYGVGVPGSVYDEHSYAGLVWHTYDLGCVGQVTSPVANVDTYLGNTVFKLTKFSVAVNNWLHYLLLSSGSLFSQLEELVSSAFQAMYTNVFTTLVSLALLVTACVILFNVRKGELAQPMLRAGGALLALTLAGLAYASPVSLSQVGDTLLLQDLTELQSQIIAGDGANARDALPTALVDRIVYDNWLRGVFGSVDVPQAEQFGRQLLSAQAFSKAEIATSADAQSLISAKQASFQAIAGQLGDRYPVFQGRSGSRIGVSILSAVQAVCLVAFQILAKLNIVVAVLLLRMTVICMPLIALVIIVWPEKLRPIARALGNALAGALIMGIAAAVHARIILWVYDPVNEVNLWLALVIMLIVTMVFFAITRPVRRLQALAGDLSAPLGRFKPQPGPAWSWLRQRLSTSNPARQSRWWEERESERSPQREPDGQRPEIETGVETRRRELESRAHDEKTVDDGEIYRPQRPPTQDGPPKGGDS